MKKKCTVVMLPTNKKAIKKGDIYQIGLQGKPGVMFHCTAGFNITSNSSAVKQHLYILSNDEVKENDWFYCELHKSVYLCETEDLENRNFIKKIIATTDSLLNLVFDNVTYALEFADKYPTHLTSIARPSNEFIKKFCEKGGIWEIMVEYEYHCDRYLCTLFHTYPKCNETCKDSQQLVKPKVAPDNTISIYPVKDNWNREEIVTLFKKYLEDIYKMYQEGNTKWDLDKWIEENL
jgi:hypothetical protein